MTDDPSEQPASLICHATLMAANLLADLLPGRARLIIFAIHQFGDDPELTSATMGAMGYEAGADLSSPASIWDGSPEAIMPIFDDVLMLMREVAAQHGLKLPIYSYGDAKQG